MSPKKRSNKTSDPVHSTPVDQGAKAAPGTSPLPLAQHRERAPFPIVGIGSSAGGLEALEEFFSHLPPDPQIAFVVVSHQHPSHASLLPEILRRWTPLPVREASDGLPVELNTVYLPPPGSRLAILHAVLHVMESGQGERPFLPIDYFFRSLAEDQQDKAIGIVLSGTGTDGSLGLKAIKGESGMTMAQEPRSAKYAGMPQSTIDAGVVDFVLPATEMGRRLCDYVHRRLILPRGLELDSDGARDFNKILLYLRDRTGNDFSQYKNNTTIRRIERRMDIHRIATLAHYLRYLQSDHAEAEALFQELLIGVTSFFRDAPVFEALATQGLPKLLDDKPDGYNIRVWVPACSTGEEAYSIAMLVEEYLSRRKLHHTLQVFGTDIDTEAIDKARQALYPEGIGNDVSPARLERFFVKEDSRYRVKKELREHIIFAPHNVLKDPPFTKLDLLSCRNFLIYLRPDTQHWIIPLFHYALKPKGVLLLGNSETIDGFAELFTPVDRKSRLFTRAAGPASLPAMETSSMRALDAVDRVPPPAVTAVHRPSYLIEPIRTLLLDRYVPAAVFVNQQGQVVYIHGRTGAYLEPAPGLASQQLVDMAREGLRSELTAALHLAEKQRSRIVRKGIRVSASGTVLDVTVTVTPLTEPEALEGLLLVTFETLSVEAAGPPDVKHAELQSADVGAVLELQYTQQRLQRTIEELQLSNEEFKSAHEEMQSTNEELQSTNEELETAKEELQSLNEELVTVNAQLQSKMEELGAANDDLQNLLNSTEVATVFLDSELRIKRFTPEAARVSKVINSDIGRPFSDIVSTVQYDGLKDDARTVFQTLVFKEREVKSLDGRWYLLRIFPYRTSKNVIDGLVLTYLDITQSKRAAEAARDARLYAESIVDTVREPLLVLDTDLHVVSANRSFYRSFKLEPQDVERHPIDRIAAGRWNQPALRAVLGKLLADDTAVEDVEIETDGSMSRPGKWIVNARRFEQSGDAAPLILLAMEHLTGKTPVPPQQDGGSHGNKS
jgi:two-component system, chemotaxis family, CheB/CheR fusion protein